MILTFLRAVSPKIHCSQAITVKRLTVNTRWRPTDAAGSETRRFWPNCPLPHRFYDFILSVGHHLNPHDRIQRSNPFSLAVMGENTYRHINSKFQLPVWALNSKS